ncbi:MAG: FAD-dependent oxidoreductase [Solirubrobacteraceae bacterium]
MRALVIGGGIGGLCAARSLDRAGLDVAVFEKAASLAQIQVGGAIHVWHNGMRGLQKLGLADDVQRRAGRAAAVERAEMRNRHGRLLTAWSVKEAEEELGAPTLGLMRPDLHRTLAAGVDSSRLQLGRRCVGFESDADGVSARFEDGSEERGDVLIGADGLRSAVRGQLLGDTPPRFAGYASWQAVAEFQAPTAPVGRFWIVWGPGARFLFYRVSAERVYWEGIFATEAGGSDPPNGRREAVQERFAGWVDPVPEIIAATEEQAISRTDSYDRPPAKRWGEGRVTLLGDAAHAMTNAAGQGANQTIEDAVVLGSCLAGASDPAAGLREYESRRMKRTASVSTLAWNLSRMSRVKNPAAVAARDRMLTVMFATVGKRAQHKDMAYEF